MTVIFAYLDEPPFCAPGAPGAGGKPTGCDVEVVFAVLRSIGVDAIETQLTTFAELLPGVASGRWHINTPLFVTAERRQLVDFSRPVWTLSDGLMLRAGDERRLNSYDALAGDAGARLVTVTGQVQEQRALAAGMPPARIERVATQAEAVQHLLDHRADAYASVAMAHRGFLKAHPNERLTVADFADTSGVTAAGAYSFSKQQPDLRQAFDRGLQDFLGTREHRGIMLRYGFTDADVDRVS
jgi:polar amino acid transport system substrate-binding protein